MLTRDFLEYFKYFIVSQHISTYFNSLNFFQSFSWAYVSTPVYFPTQGTHGSCVPRTFDMDPIHQGQRRTFKKCLTRKFTASVWMPSISSLRRCSGETNTIFKRKKINFRRMSTFFKYDLFLQICIHSLYI